MRTRNGFMLLIASLICLAASGRYMLNHYFWGHSTLIYFLSLWLIINLFIIRWCSYWHSDIRNMALAIIAGILLSIGFPPYPIIGASFVGFAFFLLHLEGSHNLQYSRRRYNWQLFSGLWLWNILTTFWVENTLFTSGLTANILNSLLMMLPFIIYRRISPFIDSKLLRYGGFISLWICFEFLHFSWDISWPWLALGHQFAHTPALIQWYEYTGVFGGSLWVLVVNVILYLLISSYREINKINTRLLTAFLSSLGIPIILSLIIYYTYESKGRSAEVLVLQPNLNPHTEKKSMPRRDQIKLYKRLINENISDNTRYVLLPESGLKNVNRGNLAQSSEIVLMTHIMEDHPNASLIAGASMTEQWSTIPELADGIRLHTTGSGDTLYWKAYNGAVQIDASRKFPTYLKSKFVPGAEFIPYPQLLFIVKPLADALGGSLEGYGTQTTRAAFEKDGLRMAPVICYESVFGGFGAGYVTQGHAQALGIITIDGWWDHTAGHMQHLYIGALRSIELRKDIARSAVTGISGFIDQRGKLNEHLDYEEEGALAGQVHFNDYLSFYAIWGDYIGRLSIFFALIVIFQAWRVYLERSRNMLL